jgi:hypothetical protein
VVSLSKPRSSGLAVPFLVAGIVFVVLVVLAACLLPVMKCPDCLGRGLAVMVDTGTPADGGRSPSYYVEPCDTCGKSGKVAILTHWRLKRSAPPE